jgi:hypothetical protein
MSQPQAAGIPREGDIIAGKYRVERVLGAGGMGVVVAAQHVRLDEKVALKFLLPNALMSAEVVARFEREARAASKIKSEHVARVSDVGTLDNGSPYMVMEYLEGRDLGEWLAAEGRLPVELATDFVIQACEAIGEAHSIGIVHRDLKPANLFCTHRTDGQPLIKVLDFGISKLTQPGVADSNMTRTSAFMGSPLYMSPEQMKTSKAVDARTDIWSLGVVLFELLTGRAPFDAEAVTELAIKIAMEPAFLVRAFRPDAPPGLEQVITRCLEKDRGQRYQTVGELAVALGPFAPQHARGSIDRIVGTERRAGRSAAVPVQPGNVAGNVAGNVDRVTGSPAVAGARAPQTGAAWGQTAPGARPDGNARGKALAAIAAILTLAFAIVVVGFLVTRKGGAATVSPAEPALANAAPSGSPGAPAASGAPAADPITPSANPDPVGSAAAPSAPVTATAPTPPEVPTTKLAATRPSRPASGSAHISPPVPATLAAPPSPPSSPGAGKANCNPPYTISATGEHEYKPECLH